MSPIHSNSCDCEHGCECRCHDGPQFHRRFQTKAEQVDDLQAYLQELESEVLAVKERLADLRSRS
jgi:uncharacterized protein YceH (UPF0502 family)